jgi:hypothetical protein
MDVYNDPEVSELLGTHCEHFSAEPFTQNLKGFDSEIFDLCRVSLLSDHLELVRPAELVQTGGEG